MLKTFLIAPDLNDHNNAIKDYLKQTHYITLENLIKKTCKNFIELNLKVKNCNDNVL